MDARRTVGSNCASIGGSVVRLDGGGVSIIIGVGPVTIFAGGSCPSQNVSSELGKGVKVSLRIHHNRYHREGKRKMGKQKKGEGKYLHESIVGCGNNYSAVVLEEDEVVAVLEVDPGILLQILHVMDDDVG